MGFRKSWERLDRMGQDVLRVLQGLEASAVRKEQDRVVDELVRGQYLRDLALLRAAVDGMPRDAMPESLQSVRILPDALLQWLTQRFEITMLLEPGEEIEVPRDRLDAYDWEGDLPADPKALVKLRVLAPGWKRSGTVLARPQVLVATG